MSRPPRGRLPAIGHRLSESLDGQLADIASSIGALEQTAPPSAGGTAGEPAGDVAGSTDRPDDDADGSNPAPPVSLDGMLDEFEFAMEAMLDDRTRLLTPRPDDGPAPRQDDA